MTAVQVNFLPLDSPNWPDSWQLLKPFPSSWVFSILPSRDDLSLHTQSYFNLAPDSFAKCCFHPTGQRLLLSSRRSQPPVGRARGRPRSCCPLLPHRRLLLHHLLLLHLVNIISESSSESNLCSLAADSAVPSPGLLSLFKVVICSVAPLSRCLLSPASDRPDTEATHSSRWKTFFFFFFPPLPFVSCQGQKLTALCPRTNLLPLPTPPNSPCFGIMWPEKPLCTCRYVQTYTKSVLDTYKIRIYTVFLFRCEHNGWSWGRYFVLGFTR